MFEKYAAIDTAELCGR